ncbi:hypothetical protein JCM8097_000111 [Rhodosporidiobolus ruineniae]
MSRITVSPVQAADVPQLAHLQRLAFEPSALNRQIFGGVAPADMEAHSAARLVKALDDPTKAVIKATLADEGASGEGDLVGFGFWDLGRPVDAPEEENKEPEKRQWPPGTNVELAEEYFARMGKGPEGRHYHLMILIVDPTRQRTGAGSALLRWGCRKADEEGVAIDLKATDVGIPLYLRFGFSAYADPVVGGVNNEISLLPMSRPALTLSPLLRSDIPQLPIIYQRSFAPTRVNQYCFPRVTLEGYTPWLEARWNKALDEKEEGGRGDVWVAKRGETVVGYASWSYAAEKRTGAGEGEGEKTERTFPEGADLDRVRPFMQRFDALKASIPYAHYSLDNLAILPEEQGTGIGKLLAKILLDKADAEHLKVTLESTEGAPNPIRSFTSLL